MKQYVYILEDKNTQLIKIGISVDPEFRATQVSKDFGCDAVVKGILEVQDAYKTERFIHGMLSDCRVVGEWFEVPDKKKGYLLTYFEDKPEPKTREAGKSLLRAKQKAQQSKPQCTTGMNKEVRQAVKNRIGELGLTQAELARRADMERSNLHRLLSGKSGQVPDSWQRVLDALGLELTVQAKK